jgi:prenyltransferase beta subunit
VLHYLNEPVSESTVEWLLSQLHPDGGFVAVPFPGRAGEPDLLSTATALHVLSLREALTRDVMEKCLAFIDSLWNEQGGYCGSRTDRTIDCEYTYYGLLSLGHLNK